MVLNKTTESEKPHLSCMERGPGPAKYNLPGTCGLKAHDPRKRSNPAFSFGTKHKQHSTLLASNQSPGPAYFVAPKLTRSGMEGTPSYSITGRPRCYSVPNIPGPAAYHTEKVPPLKTSRPPSYSFGSRTQHVKISSTPGPNAYNLPSMMGTDIVGKKSSSAFSMTGRSKIGSFHQDLKKTPGPGTYKVVDSSLTKIKKPAYSFGGRVYPPHSKGDGPGPASYRPEKVYVTKQTSPSFTFGIRHSDCLGTFEH